ncbi:MAG: hypothetical protein Kow0090_05580 [Myxococcota bacterium]
MTDIHDEKHPIWGDFPTSLFVEKSHLFKSLDEEGRQMILKIGVLRKFKPDEVIVREGEPGESFYLIKHGEVVVTTEQEGKVIELARLKRGAFFGEVALLTDKPRTATCSAGHDPVEVVEFAKPAVLKVLDKYPKVKKLLDAVMRSRAKDTIEKTIGQEEE